MAKGLESFLKRIRQDPSNETYVDRFLALLEDEELAKRLPYYRKLFDFLINFKPLSALEVSYQELKTARALNSFRDQIKALERVERCFLALERPGKAEVIRNEIDALRGQGSESAAKIPAKSRSKQARASRGGGAATANHTKISEAPPPPKQLTANVSLEDAPTKGSAPPSPPKMKMDSERQKASKAPQGRRGVETPPPPEPQKEHANWQDQAETHTHQFLDEYESYDNSAFTSYSDFTIDWSQLFAKLAEELDRFRGKRYEQLSQWIDYLAFNWTAEQKRELEHLVSLAFHDPKPEKQLDVICYFLLYCSLPELDLLLQQLTVPCIGRQLWLLVVRDLISQKRLRKAYQLLQYYCDQALSKSDSQSVLEYANQVRATLGWSQLEWHPRDGLAKLRELLSRRPEPSLRHIFIS